MTVSTTRIESGDRDDGPALDEERARETRNGEIFRFETALLVRADQEFVLATSRWVGDGALFVTADEFLPVGTEVAVSLALPAREQTIRMHGRVGFIHEPGSGPGSDRRGMGIELE